MVTATASDGRLRVRLYGADAVFSFKRKIDVPLGAVRDVSVTDDLSRLVNGLGLRLPGTAVPGLIVAGSYWRGRGQWRFCCVRRKQCALVVDLDPEAARYRRLILGVEDADRAREQIESAPR